MRKAPRRKVTLLRVVLDAKCEKTDVAAITSAVTRLRGISHVEPFADYDLEAPIEILALSTRSQNALIGASITTLRELTARSRHELGRVKNLGKLGLCEIEECLKPLGLQLRSQLRGRGEFMQRAEQESAQPAEGLDKIVAVFNEVRPALRRLWRAVEAKGYVTQNWQDWQMVDTTIRRYARAAAEHAGVDPWEIDSHITACDSEPFLRSKGGANLGEVDRSNAQQPSPGDGFAWEHGFVAALATAHLMNHDLQAVTYALKQAGLTAEKLERANIAEAVLALMRRALARDAP